MASITSLKASDGTGNASVATVQSVRSSGATTLVVDTVQGINTKFHATMGTPHTFVDPVTSETITVISEATAVDFKGHVDGGNLEIDTIAPGFTDNGSAVNDIVIIKPTTQWADQVATVLDVSHDDDGTLKAGAVDNAGVLATDVVETAKIKDGAVTAGKTAFGGSYTTSEVDTGFKWVDGKTIYKKTVSLGAMPNNTNKNVAHGITTPDTFIKQEGMITNGTNTHTLPTVSNSTNTASLRISFTSTNIVLETNANWSTYTGYSTIWYTKV